MIATPELKEGDIVLLKGQVDPAFNGVFTVGSVIRFPKTDQEKKK